MFGSIAILVAEPSQDIRTEIEFLLTTAGFKVIFAEGREAPRLLEERSYDLVILDACLPGASGADVCQAIRERSQVPVIMITTPGEEQEIFRGLDAGATDFILQPFRPKELVARVRTVLRRTTTPLVLPGWILQHADLMLDLRSRKLVKDGHSIALTRTELRLLHFFMRHPGETLSKDTLLRNVWEYHANTRDYNLVDTAIKRLRQSIEDDPKQPKYIHTVWGEGFRFGD